MVLRNLAPSPAFSEFGIAIPITGSNAGRTIEYLLGIPRFAAARARWLHEENIAPLTREAIVRVHQTTYVDRLLSDACDADVLSTFELINPDGSYHRYDPKSATRSLTELRDRGLAIAAGTTRAAEYALERGFCYYLGGGMHHGQYDFGEGFCLVNDVVIAARAMQAAGKAKTVWIIDIDAHKGDGTAALVANDPTIVAFSVHMRDGWPLDQPRTLPDGRPNPSFVPSDIDIEIAVGEEATYVPRMKAGLAQLAQGPRADLAIVLAGADPYERDQLESARLLQMTREQMFERDQAVYQFLADLQVPAAFLTAGNYGYHSWEVFSQFLEWVLPLRGLV